MRVCFLPDSLDAAGCYRCLFPARELRARGHKAAMPPHRNYRRDDGFLLTHFPELDRTLASIEADVFVFHRQMEAVIHGLIQAIQDRGLKVVCDTDDDDLGIPSWNPAFEGTNPRLHPGRNRNHFQAALAAADAVSVATPFLAERVSRLNGDVTVLPNYLDWEMWAEVEPQYEVERERIRVGWMGDGKWRQGDLRILSGLLGPWLERHPEVEFVAAGDESIHELLEVPEAQRVSYPPVHFRELKLPKITATMDIGLVPLADNGFNEAKSALKGMEYAACGIPCIATPTGPYRDWVDEGENGLLARRPRDWIRCLDSLVADQELRRRMGKQARAKAAKHTIQRHVSKWEAFYARVAGSPDLAREAIARGAIQKHGELKALLELLSSRKLDTVCEIGTARGGTLYALCQLAAPEATIISIDLPGGPFGGGYAASEIPRLRGYAQHGQDLHLLRRDSHKPETRAELEEILAGRSLDLLLIDGDHSYEGVRADYELYAPLVDGLLAFHDVLPHPTVPECQVDRLWRELKQQHSYTELLDRGDWGGFGVLYLDNPRSSHDQVEQGDRQPQLARSG